MYATNSPLTTFLKKCIAVAAAPTLLASALLLGQPILSSGSQTALAKPKTCKEKKWDCEARCRGRYPGDWKQISGCYSRTCDKQHDNCKGASGTPSNHAPPQNETKSAGGGVRPTGGHKPLPRTPKIMGTRAPLSSVKQSPSAGGGGPILRSGGGTSLPSRKSGGGRR